MDIVVFFIGLGIGAAIGYGVFYFRYEDRGSVDGLRGNLDHSSNENVRLDAESKELTQQNLILKEKVTELLMKNNDLSSIVGELNRYYYYLKEGYIKANELVNMLKGVDPVMEEKIKTIVSNMETSNSGYKSSTHSTNTGSSNPTSTNQPVKNTATKAIPIGDKPTSMPDLKKKR